MRRAIIHTSFSLLFAVLFLFAGTGYNLVHFCCNSCRDAGIALIATQLSCEEVHALHTQDHDLDNRCSTDTDVCALSASDDCCSMERLTVDVPLLIEQNISKIIDYTLILFKIDFHILTLWNTDLYNSVKYFSPSPPFHKTLLSGRAILSLKSVLTI